MADNNKNNLRFGHRDRLRQKMVEGKLTDAERLELLIADVVPRCDVHNLSRELIQQFGGVSQVLCASIEELESVKGVGHIVAVHLKLVNEIMLNGYRMRLAETKVFYDQRVLSNYCLTLLSGKMVEELHILYLDTEYRLLADDLGSIGTVDEAPIYERDIVKRALNLNARHVILLHNHPMCSEPFSSSDILATKEVIKLLNMFDIDLYDHYVVANGILYSARNMQLLK